MARFSGMQALKKAIISVAQPRAYTVFQTRAMTGFPARLQKERTVPGRARDINKIRWGYFKWGDGKEF
jgi:hypothetical protein